MKRIAVALLVVVAILIGQALPKISSLWAQPAASRAPDATASGQIYAKTYGGYEFLALSSDLTYGTHGTGMYATSVPIKSFRLALSLPNGAQVLTATIFLVDNDPVNNMAVHLISYTASLTTSTNIATADTSALPNSPAVQSISMSGSPHVTLDNNSHGYAILYQPIITGTAHMLVGARLEYTLPTSILALP